MRGSIIWSLVLIGLLTFAFSCARHPKPVPATQSAKTPRPAAADFDGLIEGNAGRMLEEGRKIFRFDTFGSQNFWGDKLRLHEAIGELTPKKALELGLKIDHAAVPAALLEAPQGGADGLENSETTLELLRANAVVGLTGFFDHKNKKLRAVGIQCAFCHSTVDDSLTPGIGRRLDGWPNRDLDVGAIIAMAPNLQHLASQLRMDDVTLRKILLSWGPGKYDAILSQDGIGFRPGGKSAAVLIPAVFGLAGIHLQTYTGWGSISYWNAYAANTQMMGMGTFFDPRLANASQFPVGAVAGNGQIRQDPDLVTFKLAALQFYQLAMPAPSPPKDGYEKDRAEQGQRIFKGKAKCAACHVPPLFSEPGWAMHTGKEIGIDDFQANRSPEKRYRTTPLRGLFTRMKGGFYHDGRFATLQEVVEHYNRVLDLKLTPAEQRDLVEYLKTL
jgi:mono/diheme cytochrome c family protein